MSITHRDRVPLRSQAARERLDDTSPAQTKGTPPTRSIGDGLDKMVCDGPAGRVRPRLAYQDCVLIGTVLRGKAWAHPASLPVTHHLVELIAFEHVGGVPLV